jgi:hypothetical protein
VAQSAPDPALARTAVHRSLRRPPALPRTRRAAARGLGRPAGGRGGRVQSESDAPTDGGRVPTLRPMLDLDPPNSSRRGPTGVRPAECATPPFERASHRPPGGCGTCPSGARSGWAEQRKSPKRLRFLRHPRTVCGAGGPKTSRWDAGPHGRCGALPRTRGGRRAQARDGSDARCSCAARTSASSSGRHGPRGGRRP